MELKVTFINGYRTSYRIKHSYSMRKIFRVFRSYIRCPPRHSHLGPLLFSFADDAYIYRSISSRKDADTLQKDLDKLGEWEKNWSMEFHLNKCQLLRITNKCKIVDAHYMIHGKRLKLVDSAKYLGVTLTKNLSWKNHIRIITAKANNT